MSFCFKYLSSAHRLNKDDWCTLRVFIIIITFMSKLYIGPPSACTLYCCRSTTVLLIHTRLELRLNVNETFLFQQMNVKTHSWCKTPHIHQSAQWSSNTQEKQLQAKHIFVSIINMAVEEWCVFFMHNSFTLIINWNGHWLVALASVFKH